MVDNNFDKLISPDRSSILLYYFFPSFIVYYLGCVNNNSNDNT